MPAFQAEMLSASVSWLLPQLITHETERPTGYDNDVRLFVILLFGHGVRIYSAWRRRPRYQLIFLLFLVLYPHPRISFTGNGLVQRFLMSLSFSLVVTLLSRSLPQGVLFPSLTYFFFCCVYISYCSIILSLFI